MRRGLRLLLLVPLACAHVDSSLTPREQAMADLAGGHPERAVPVLDALSRGAPRDLSVARARVEAYAKAGRLDELLARLDRAEEKGLRPAAVMLYMTGLSKFARATDAEPAAGDFRRAIELEPNEPEFHYRLGLALLESEQYEAALAPLERASQLAPAREGYALPLAKCLYRVGRRKEAVAALHRLLTQDPTPQEIATGRALMEVISNPMAGLPAAAKPRVEEGLGWLDREVIQNAIVSFEDVLHDFPDLAGVHALLGLAYERLDDAGQAVEELKRAIELAPAEGKNYFYLGEVYASHQRGQQARESFEKAVALNPFLDGAYLRLGDLALESKDLPKAHDNFGTLNRLKPDAPEIIGKYALVLQLEGDLPAAEKELRRVVDKDAENVEFTLRIGLLEAERFAHAKAANEREQARTEGLKWLGEVLKRQPDNAIASRAVETLRANPEHR